MDFSDAPGDMLLDGFGANAELGSDFPVGAVLEHPECKGRPTLRRQGLNPLPTYVAPDQPPKGAFRLLVGKQSYFTHAANQNNAWLHELDPENRLWINRVMANQRAISDGDWLKVQSTVGAVRIRAHVTDRIRADCVHLPHGFGHRSPALRLAHNIGASDQDLIATRWDRISGNAALHETFVTVEKA